MKEGRTWGETGQPDNWTPLRGVSVSVRVGCPPDNVASVRLCPACPADPDVLAPNADHSCGLELLGRPDKCLLTCVRFVAFCDRSLVAIGAPGCDLACPAYLRWNMVAGWRRLAGVVDGSLQKLERNGGGTRELVLRCLRGRFGGDDDTACDLVAVFVGADRLHFERAGDDGTLRACLLYTSDAADE